jgi:hypothetical protein
VFDITASDLLKFLSYIILISEKGQKMEPVFGKMGDDLPYSTCGFCELAKDGRSLPDSFLVPSCSIIHAVEAPLLPHEVTVVIRL